MSKLAVDKVKVFVCGIKDEAVEGALRDIGLI